MKILYDTAVMDTCHLTFPHPTERTPPRVNLKVNYGLRVITRCRCRLMGCNRCAALVGEVDDGGGCACGAGDEVHGKSLYVPLGVAVILQLALKTKSIFFKKIHCMTSS